MSLLVGYSKDGIISNERALSHDILLLPQLLRAQC